MIAIRHRPPGLPPVPMNAVRSHGYSRFPLITGQLMLERVKDKPVDAGCKCPVALCLHRSWILFPTFVLPCRESFRRYQRDSVNMCNGGGFDTTKGRVESIILTPEFTHRNVCDCS